MLKSKLENYYPSNWSDDPFIGSTYREVKLHPGSSEYLRVKSGMIPRRITHITRVESPELYGYFLLKTAEYDSRGVSTTVQELYHDTSQDKIDSILSTNLDWRVVVRAKFGRGVSFSPFAQYANKEANKWTGSYRAMIIADVLVGNNTVVHSSSTLPPSSYDTSIGNGGNVYVKFYDNEFYPKYIIYYEGR